MASTAAAKEPNADANGTSNKGTEVAPKEESAEKVAAESEVKSAKEEKPRSRSRERRRRSKSRSRSRSGSRRRKRKYSVDDEDEITVDKSKRSSRSRGRRRSRSRGRRRSDSRGRRSRHRRRSRSRDRRRSRSRDRRRSRSYERRRRRRRSRSRSRSRKHKREKKSKKRERSPSKESEDGNNSEDGLTEDQKVHKRELEKLTRDARTVFVSQLQVKVTEKDLKKFFQAVCNVKDVVLIRDRFTNRSKGFGYVEVKTLEDVPKALMLTGQRFIFRNGKQGFPISVKASEAEKNFTHQLEKRVASMSSAPTGAQLSAGGGAGKSVRPSARSSLLEDETWDDKLVVSNIHPNIEEAQLKELCASFGAIKHLELIRDRDGKRNGSANIHFEQSIDALKALKELNGLDLAGLKLEVTKLRKTPSERARDKYGSMRAGDDPFKKENMDSRSWRLEDDDVDVGRVGGGGVSMNSHTRASLMSKLGGGLGENMLQQSASTQEKQVVEKKEVGPGRIQGVASRYLCIKNMFDPRTETEPDWDQAIAEDTKMECENFGTVLHCAVDKESAGNVYVAFDTIQAGVDASHALHGRWFAKRRVVVEYLKAEVYHAKYPATASL